MATSTPKQIVSGFISYLKEQELYDSLPEVVKELEKEMYRNQDIAVISAVPLTKEEVKDLEKTLTDKWGEHPFVYTVDPVVLSGLIVKFQDKIIDMSGRGKLTDLAQELK